MRVTKMKPCLDDGVSFLNERVITLCVKKKSVEFSKKLVAWALANTSICVAISYILSYLDKDPCAEITVSIASACIAIAVAYEAKSFGEKNSRNKYGVSIDNKDESAVG